MTARDPLGVADTLSVGTDQLQIYCVDRLDGVDPSELARRPLTERILLENLLRRFDPKQLDAAQVRAFANGKLAAGDVELPFYPGRVLLQDFTGVPVVVDLASLRDEAERRGLPSARINPQVPVDLVVDHSVQVDSYGSPRSILVNLDREYERNSERYALLRWATTGLERFRVVPPGNGIVHQVNLEYLASVVTRRPVDGVVEAFPDTLIGTDSHTTMVNGLSVLGWGVGGIEAEAVMLGEPYFLSLPEVVGVHLTGSLPEGATATDLVLTVTRALRAKGVVDRFVEFYGPGVLNLSVADRATISNMCPEYGATAALFPVDDATLSYLRGTGRPEPEIARVEAYAKRQGFWGFASASNIAYDEHLEIDLAAIVPTIAGPRNPEESVALVRAPEEFLKGLQAFRTAHPVPTAAPPPNGVSDGSIVIAAITSCTNTSNPAVMIGAGLVARRAVELGLRVPPYVKTSMAPGSKVVTAYLQRSGLLEPLEKLGFSVVGYGCTTCIGNSGPLPPEVEKAVRARDAYVAAVLSGNRNFEARIHNLVRANYLMSPMLVVAHALAGRMDINLATEPIGHDAHGAPVRLKDLWPTAAEIRRLVEANLDPGMYREKYKSIFVGDAHWEGLAVPSGTTYPWAESSTYLRHAPYLELPPPPNLDGPALVDDARALLVLGDRVSTDHISPAGEIAPDGAAAAYLTEHGVPEREFNTYGSRRGNHEVMVRGTFANVRLKNLLVQPKEGGYTQHLPDGVVGTVFEIAERYRAEGTPLIVFAGKSYGQGSSRDWAAKGPLLLGVRAVIAESYERIHRSNLVDMGILPLQFVQGQSLGSLGLSGRERYSLRLPAGNTLRPRAPVEVTAHREDGVGPTTFRTELRVYSPVEVEYLHAGGILPYVFGKMVRAG
ncbi:MAG TPA: aconitate hydratase AcnA [Thermoplasmata archaeon]|nr:aconitate hydratase AcnA [Thermoplasmata archaeon]